MQREKEIANILLSILDFIYGYIYIERERERKRNVKRRNRGQSIKSVLFSN